MPVANNIRHIALFKPLPWQVEPWKDMSDTVLFTGSAGGGKSRLAAEKLHGFCQRYPGAMALMLRKTRESMTNSTVLFTDRMVIANDPKVRHFPSKNRFEYANGSILAYGGMKNEEQREQIRSIGQDGSVDIAWLEEANKFAEDDFQEVIARMRGKAAPWRQILLTTNPDAPTHWINKRLIQSGEAFVYYSGARDNPHNPPEYIEALGKLTGVMKLRLDEGKWVQAEGAVYEMFDDAVHVIDDVDENIIRRRIASVDWGFTNPGVIQVWGVDGDGRMYLLYELYRTGETITWWVQQAKRIQSEHHPEVFVCDPSEPGHIQEFKNAGLKAVGANNDVRLGIQAVTDRLEIAGDGKPRIFFLRDALSGFDRHLEEQKLPTCTLEEFPAYVWQEGRDGKPLREEPVDKDNHGLDATRYGAMHFEQPRKRARGMNVAMGGLGPRKR